MSQTINITAFAGVPCYGKLFADGDGTQIGTDITGIEDGTRAGYFAFAVDGSLTGLHNLDVYRTSSDAFLGRLWAYLQGDGSSVDGEESAALAMQVVSNQSGSNLFTIQPVASQVGSGRVSRNKLTLYVAGTKPISIGVIDENGSVDLTGKNLAFIIRKKHDKSLLLKKTTADSEISINANTATVTVEAADIPDGTEETEYDGALREVDGALDGHVWAWMTVDVVYASTVDDPTP